MLEAKAAVKVMNLGSSRMGLEMSHQVPRTCSPPPSPRSRGADTVYRVSCSLVHGRCWRLWLTVSCCVCVLFFLVVAGDCHPTSLALICTCAFCGGMLRSNRCCAPIYAKDDCSKA